MTQAMSDDPMAPSTGEARNSPETRAGQEEEIREWVEALEELVLTEGADAAKRLLRELLDTIHRRGVSLQFAINTPYVNSIPRELQRLSRRCSVHEVATAA